MPVVNEYEPLKVYDKKEIKKENAIRKQLSKSISGKHLRVFYNYAKPELNKEFDTKKDSSGVKYITAVN